MIRVLIVDDEPRGRQGVRVRLAAEPDVEIVGEAADGPEAVERIVELRPDLVFLDIQMPEMDGFEVLDRVSPRHLPTVVFVSAFDQYAIRAFEVHALDYLLKPYTRERFGEALRRARVELAHAERRSPERLAAMLDERRESGAGRPITRFVVREQQHFLLLPAHEVEWIRAAENYVELFARGKSFLSRQTMKALLERLDPTRFARIHRSVIVNLDRVRQIRPGPHGDFEVLIEGGRVLPMSRTHRRALLPKA